MGHSRWQSTYAAGLFGQVHWWILLRGGLPLLVCATTRTLNPPSWLMNWVWKRCKSQNVFIYTEKSFLQSCCNFTESAVTIGWLHDLYSCRPSKICPISVVLPVHFCKNDQRNQIALPFSAVVSFSLHHIRKVEILACQVESCIFKANSSRCKAVRFVGR